MRNLFILPFSELQHIALCALHYPLLSRRSLFCCLGVIGIFASAGSHWPGLSKHHGSSHHSLVWPIFAGQRP